MRYLLAIALTMFLAVPAFAAFQGPGAQPGGYCGPGAQNDATVQQAKGMPDDAKVVLTGSIVNQLPYDHEKYTFRDGTGEIIVDIDQKYFRGQTVTPQNTVRIFGEVEKDFGKDVEIDVKRLDVIK